MQVVMALIVTPEGFPLAYEVLAGNTSDKTTLGDFLAKIEKQEALARTRLENELQDVSRQLTRLVDALA